MKAFVIVSNYTMEPGHKVVRAYLEHDKEIAEADLKLFREIDDDRTYTLSEVELFNRHRP